MGNDSVGGSGGQRTWLETQECKGSSCTSRHHVCLSGVPSHHARDAQIPCSQMYRKMCMEHAETWLPQSCKLQPSYQAILRRHIAKTDTRRGVKTPSSLNQTYAPMSIFGGIAAEDWPARDELILAIQKITDQGVDGEVEQTLQNNILPLSPDLHKALDGDELWLNPLSCSAHWLGDSAMPPSLFVRNEMGPWDGFETYAGAETSLLPSLFAASCRTLVSRFASRRLRAIFANKAGQILNYRDGQRESTLKSRGKSKQPVRPVPTDRQAGGSKSASWGEGGSSSKPVERSTAPGPPKRKMPESVPLVASGSPILAENLWPFGEGYLPPTPSISSAKVSSPSTPPPRKPTLAMLQNPSSGSSQPPTNLQVFESWWVRQERPTLRRLVTRLKRIADEAFHDEYHPRTTGGHFRAMVEALDGHLAGRADASNQELRAVCRRVGENLDEVAADLARFCATVPRHEVEGLYARLCAQYEADAFFVAWPAMLSRAPLEA